MGTLLWFIAFFWSDLPLQLPALHTSIALIYSALVSSVLAMIFYDQLLSKVNPTILMLITIMTSVPATPWGTWLDQETLGSHLILGLFLLCGIVLIFLFHPHNCINQMKNPECDIHSGF